RQRELRDKPLTYSKYLERLDPLFPAPGEDGKAAGEPVRYVSESGKFEPGKIAAAEKAKLPKDAILVVEQLLIWMPDDLRLYWQLGELFNAHGDVNAARTIFMEFLKKYPLSLDPNAGPTSDKQLIKLFLPKFTEKYPEVGARLKALLDYEPPVGDMIQGQGTQSKDQAPPPGSMPAKGDVPAAALNIDWQTLGVGFGIGLCCGILFVWQLREIRRRRLARAGMRFQP